MKLQEAIFRVRLRSEAEAVLLNLPPEMGLEVYDGMVADDLEEWSEDTFIDWCDYIQAKYETKGCLARELYRAISKVMGEYAKLLE